MNTYETYVLTGKNPGNNVVVMVGVHGDEICGPEALARILPNLSIDTGKVTFVWGNPEALRIGARFIDSNLNRLFQSNDALTDEQRSSYEYSRSREILPVLQTADALLDVHSSATPNSVPFIICEPHSFDIASVLPTELISSGWDAIQPGGTDSFVNKKGGKGICIECGYHNDVEAIDRAEEAIYTFLKSTGNISGSIPTPSEGKVFMNVTFLYKSKINFTPIRQFNDFERVTSGELIGIDAEEMVSAPYDGFVLFVRQRETPDQEAFLIAQELDKK